MSFDEIMIHWTAPSLCGIKPASLFTVRNENYSFENFNFWKSEIKKAGLKILEIKKADGLNLFLVYDEHWLSEIIFESHVFMFLNQKGYEKCKNVNQVINHLAKKLESEQNSPHEIGVFLGYPLRDVIAFEKEKGKNFKFCGYWKAYGDVDSARQICSLYENCTDFCLKCFFEGWNVEKIIKKYKKAVLDAA